jgi:hypothetical protein
MSNIAAAVFNNHRATLDPVFSNQRGSLLILAQQKNHNVSTSGMETFRIN